MTRRSYVFLQGELREIAGDNSCIINGEKWYRSGPAWVSERDLGQAAPTVIGDITPYQSMVDGTQITSRSHHREHLRAHGCIEVGNERLPAPKREFTAAQGLRQELIARFNR